MKRFPEPDQAQEHTAYLPQMKPVPGFLLKTMATGIAVGLARSLNAGRGTMPRPNEILVMD